MPQDMTNVYVGAYRPKVDDGTVKAGLRDGEGETESSNLRFIVASLIPIIRNTMQRLIINWRLHTSIPSKLSEGQVKFYSNQLLSQSYAKEPSTC